MPSDVATNTMMRLPASELMTMRDDFLKEGQSRSQTYTIRKGHVEERQTSASERLDAGGDQTKNEWIEFRRSALF